MDYSKFYTPPKIAHALIEKLNITEPSKVIDICCGSCNLLRAAKKRWPQIQMYGVDVSENHVSKEVQFYRKDGRQFALEHPQEFSLVVANPPFDYVEKQKEFSTLFEDVFDNFETSRLEVEMLIANLRLLKPNGVLLIILPSSFVEAQTYCKIRKLIANNYYIESIIKLDESTFGASKINSYALIIHNKHQEKHSAKLGNSVDNNIVYNSKVDADCLKKGVWIVENPKTNCPSLNIKRGNISSAAFITRGQPILHTAKFRDDWKPSRRYISKKVIPTVFAENGDIIVSRIGKSAGQWCVYSGDKIPISDCLYCIKDPDGSVLDSIKGRKFDRTLKGVATRYITMSDFISWISLR